MAHDPHARTASLMDALFDSVEREKLRRRGIRVVSLQDEFKAQYTEGMANRLPAGPPTEPRPRQQGEHVCMACDHHMTVDDLVWGQIVHVPIEPPAFTWGCPNCSAPWQTDITLIGADGELMFRREQLP